MEKKEKNVRSPWTILRSWKLWLAAAVAVLVVAAGVAYVRAVASSDRNHHIGALPYIQTAPGFLLRDQQNRSTSLFQFRGKVVALAFIDPECTEICPLTTHSMVEALKILGPKAASHVQLLAIDVNPTETSVADVADYTRTHQLQGRWRFLTGSLAQLQKVWQEYQVYVSVARNSHIELSAAVILIDRNGNERGIYSSAMSYEAVGGEAHSLARGIKSLLTGNTDLDASGPVSLQPATPLLNPAKTDRLTALGPKPAQVEVGGSHPHLYVFFAGWLGPDADLAKDLGTLDTYAHLAQQRGWPSPVAIDVFTTESSAAEAQKELDPLAATLRTPIVEDKTGRLADSYQVEDLPWFVLSTGSGRILWHHNGWLSSVDLDKQVHAALSGSRSTRQLQKSKASVPSPGNAGSAGSA
jgi:cytochrome oxidase Cu insertion factor (SCO1/SenC/PrrC family)